MARVIRRISPWLKVLKYLEYSGFDGRQGLNCTREDRNGSMLREEREPWDPDECGFVVDEEDMPEAYPDSADLPIDPSDDDIARYLPGSEYEENHRLEDDEAGVRDDDLSYAFPPWLWQADYGRAAFEAELHTPLRTPMLEEIHARIYWKNDVSHVTLKMLCGMTYPLETFDDTFRLAIYFEDEGRFKSAPWEDIDMLLQCLALRYILDMGNDHVKYWFTLKIATRGWDLRSSKTRKLKLAEVKERLPRVVDEGVFQVGVVKWQRRNASAGRDDVVWKY
ncbi:hypothetical protein GY45DRAFT_1327474 [Cubamyces sp. BRFM 1775]|nr:hypothetical protein GY45DRAFT_1327474 [Cubamyces sp. BRFM 1775]